MIKKIIILFFLATFAGLPVFAASVANDPQSKMTGAIISYLVSKKPEYAGKKIEVTYKYADKVFRELHATKGKVNFLIAELYPGFMPVGNIIVPVQVVIDDVPKEKIFLRTKVAIFENIIVAKKRLSRGDQLTNAEAGIEERDVASLNPDVIRDINFVMGKEMKTFVPGGNPIYSWMIKDRPLVKKNEKVRIIAVSENVAADADGISLEDGNMGSEVKVKALISGKELIGEVSGTGEVTIK